MNDTKRLIMHLGMAEQAAEMRLRREITLLKYMKVWNDTYIKLMLEQNKRLSE